MKQMRCPLNGLRNINEFEYGGVVQEVPYDAAAAEHLGDYLFLRDNAAGIVREWWCHAPTAYWFIAERHTVTDEILRTFAASELFSSRFEIPGSGP